MGSFKTESISIAGAPTINFNFDGDIGTAECSGARLVARAIDQDSATIQINHAGELLADLTVRRLPSEESITITVIAVGSALLWSHARYVEASQSKEPFLAPRNEPTHGIYRYYEDFGRMGDLSGVFVCETRIVQAMMGKTVHLGEVLGKHSEVSADITPETVTLVSSDPKVVEMFRELQLGTGIDPISTYIEYEAECGRDPLGLDKEA